MYESSYAGVSIAFFAPFYKELSPFHCKENLYKRRHIKLSNKSKCIK